jgi:hypothetical protein
MHLDRYFDAIYLGLNVAMVVALVAAIALGVVRRVRSRNAASRALGSGAILLAVGTAVALGGGLLADAALKSTPWFQQVRFGLYYLGFAGILWGTIVILRGCVRAASRGWITRALVIAYAAAVVIAAAFVCIPATFVLNQYGEQVQLVIYWLPLLVASAGGCVALLGAAAVGTTVLTARLRLIAVFEGLLFIGLLRESLILPDLGEPLLKILVSYFPL